ncbi:hypothetical protein, partial [Salmonella enterica]|uniref:hypothetical protein n=1 Tax=Salmonella enterica TaxID=28901 RepID=UPI003CE81885
ARACGKGEATEVPVITRKLKSQAPSQKPLVREAGDDVSILHPTPAAEESLTARVSAREMRAVKHRVGDLSS